jgi:hypothetical protein
VVAELFVGRRSQVVGGGVGGKILGHDLVLCSGARP